MFKAKQERTIAEPVVPMSDPVSLPLPPCPTTPVAKFDHESVGGSTPTAAKTGSRAGRPASHPLTRAERNAFDTRRRNAPESVQKEWDRLKSLPPNHTQRKKLFDAIANVANNDYSDCELCISFEFTKASGTLSYGGPIDDSSTLRPCFC